MDEEARLPQIMAIENIVPENADTNNVSLIEDNSNSADEFICNKLNEWNLSEYIEIFKRERIDEVSFFNMSDDDVKLLIKPIGHYVRFIFERSKLMGSSTQQPPTQSSTSYQSGSRLRKLLLSSPNGKYLLKHSPTGTKANDLATLIINYLLHDNPQLSIDRNKFLIWSKEIQSLWPEQEQTTWYKPAADGKKASGKLYHKYTNTLKKIKPTLLLINDEEVKEFNLAIEESSKQFIEELNTLTIDDRDRILILWEKTHDFRRMEKITITQYFNKYPHLNPPFGKELIELDFKLLKLPIDVESLERKWIDLHVKILEIATSFPIAKKILKQLENNQDIPKTTLAWKILPYLFKPTLKKKNWKPSTKEQSDAFILWLHTMTDIEARLNEQRNLMTEKNFTLQPMIVAVGPLAKLDAVYVIVDDKKFQFNDVTSAVGFCWKLIFALNAKYSEVCDAIWVFIEQYIYNYHSDKIVDYQSVHKVITYLENLSADNNGSMSSSSFVSDS